mgnify:CR=1 FL=1
MNRRKDRLIQTEADILLAAQALLQSGREEFHTYALSREVQALTGARLQISHAALYQAVKRLEGMGYLAGRWETPDGDAGAGPPRRMYRLAGSYAVALASFQADRTPPAPQWNPAGGTAQ